MCFQESICRLQEEARLFLTESGLVLNGVSILPKEIEVYFYKKDIFEDDSVHRNELQKHNKNHFYVHRRGTKQSDSYKGGNRAGLDFVVSNDENTYYSYLIRSATINNRSIVGPHKVLEAIKSATHMDYKEIENTPVKVVHNNVLCDVLYSYRINLGKKVQEEYRICKLRAVICDEMFRNEKYPAKEKLVVDFLLEKVKMHNTPQEQAAKYAKDKLGYIPSVIKDLRP